MIGGIDTQKFLTVGTSEIDPNKFQDIKDSTSLSSIKPNGGLWLSEHFNEYLNYNSWVDYIVYNPYILFYKTKGNPFKQPCSIIKLKKDCNIFILDSKDKYYYLKENFPDNYKRFSFEKISKIYNGFYINLSSLKKDNLDEISLFYSFNVNSLILFNAKEIEYYYSGFVDIEPFDFEFNQEIVNYEIHYDDKPKNVESKIKCKNR